MPPEKVQPRRAAKKRKAVDSPSEHSEEEHEIQSESKKTETQSSAAKLEHQEMQGTTFKDYKFLLLKETKSKKARGKKNEESWEDQMQSLIE